MGAEGSRVAVTGKEEGRREEEDRQGSSRWKRREREGRRKE